MKTLFLVFLAIHLGALAAHAQSETVYICSLSDFSKSSKKDKIALKKEVKFSSDKGSQTVFSTEKIEIKIDRQESFPKGPKKKISLSVFQKGKSGGVSAFTEEGNSLTLANSDYEVSVSCSPVGF